MSEHAATAPHATDSATAGSVSSPEFDGREKVMFGQDDARSEVFVPLNTAQAMKPDQGVYAVGQTKTAEAFEDAKAEITFAMRRSRNLKGDDPNTFGIEAIEQYIAQVRRIGNMITICGAALVMVALLVGGVGIMVIQLVSVTERTREIGLRKAVGAEGSKGSCHSDYVEPQTAQQIQEQRLVQLRTKPEVSAAE